MPDLEISQLPSATVPFGDASLLALVQGGTTKKGTITQLNETIAAVFDRATVGATGAQYPTINAAYAAGYTSLWAVSDITETTTTTYTDTLDILVNGGVQITAMPDVKFIANDIAASIVWEILGTATISFSLTSPGVFMDASAATLAYAAVQIKGSMRLQNTSSPTLSVQPIEASYAYIDSIIYETDGGIDSNLRFNNVYINNFDLFPTTNTEDCSGLIIGERGHIGNFLLSGDCSDNSILYNVTNTTMVSTTSHATTGTPTAYLINSSCLTATGINTAIKFRTSAINSGEVSIIQNGRNIITIPEGAYASIFSNCYIAGCDFSGLTTGAETQFTACDIAPAITINGAGTYWNFTDVKFKGGLTITASAGTQLTGCDYGVPGGAFGLTLAGGAVNTTVMGGRTNTAINAATGVNTIVEPLPQLF